MVYVYMSHANSRKGDSYLKGGLTGSGIPVLDSREADSYSKAALCARF